MRLNGRFSLSILLAISVSACGANHNSIYRHNDIAKNGQSITLIDAKQRAILTAIYKKKGNDPNDPQTVRRFCSESSPDVFSVIAQSLSVAGSFGQTADPKAIEASLNAAFSSAETGSTIPRTQTINMLRELMFRTCERYLSGGIDSLELSVQAVRDQRLMVSILAIEQLTGAISPKPVIIGASGAGTSGAGSSAIVKLDEARNAKKAADKATLGAKEEFDSLNTTEGHCDAVNKAVADGKEDELKDKPGEKKEACKKAQAKINSTKTDQTEANDHYSDLKRLAASSGVSVNTEIFAQGDGGLDRAHDVAVDKVATVVRDIVGLNYNDDTETMLFCLKAIKEIKNYGLSESDQARIISQCIGYLNADVRAAAQKRMLAAQKFEAALSQLDVQETSDFGSFWKKIALNPDAIDAPASRVKEYIRSIISDYDNPETNIASEKLVILASQVTRTEMFEAFQALDVFDQQRLAEGLK